MLHADFTQRLQAPQLQRAGHFADDARGLGQGARGIALAFGLDDAGAFLADRLGLARDRPLHLLGNVEVLDLDRVDRHAPLGAGRAQQFEQAGVDRGAVLQDLVEFALADGVAHAGLGGLDHRRLPVDHRGYDQLGLDRAVPQHGVDLHRHAVARHRFLRGQREGDRAQIDLDHAVDDRDQPEPARTLGLDQPPEAKDDAALVFLIDAKAFQRQHQQEDAKDRRYSAQCAQHDVLPIPPARLFSRRAYSSGAMALIARACTLCPGMSPNSRLTRRWRSSRDIPAKAALSMTMVKCDSPEPSCPAWPWWLALSLITSSRLGAKALRSTFSISCWIDPLICSPEAFPA